MNLLLIGMVSITATVCGQQRTLVATDGTSLAFPTAYLAHAQLLAATLLDTTSTEIPIPCIATGERHNNDYDQPCLQDLYTFLEIIATADKEVEYQLEELLFGHHNKLTKNRFCNLIYLAHHLDIPPLLNVLNKKLADMFVLDTVSYAQHLQALPTAWQTLVHEQIEYFQRAREKS